MILEGAPGQVAVAGDIDQGSLGIPPAKLLPQLEAVPFPVLQLYIQEINPLPTPLQSGQQLLGGGDARRHLHVVVFRQDLPLQGGLDLAADGVIIVTEIDLLHVLSSTVSSCTNIPLSQLVQEEALG